VQYTSLALDNERGEAIAAMLVRAATSAVRKARLAHYTLAGSRLMVDTTYRFSTPNAASSSEAHVYEEDFIAVPGKGFMFLKEYGRRFTPSSWLAELSPFDQEALSDSALIHPGPVAVNKKGYTRFGNLSVTRRAFERGDLYVHYFPVQRSDSSWSGLINITQTGELNAACLSYACMASKGKILFLYNSSSFGFDRFSTTTLNQKGYSLDEDLVFWKGSNIMNFQRSRQIGTEELVVPYERNRLQGFAVIRL
jgi:hypothetical protein